MKFSTPHGIGEGTMSWTVIHRDLGALTFSLVSTSHDKEGAWQQAQEHFKNGVVAMIRGNHQVITAGKSLDIYLTTLL